MSNNNTYSKIERVNRGGGMVGGEGRGVSSQIDDTDRQRQREGKYAIFFHCVRVVLHVLVVSTFRVISSVKIAFPPKDLAYSYKLPRRSSFDVNSFL